MKTNCDSGLVANFVSKLNCLWLNIYNMTPVKSKARIGKSSRVHFNGAEENELSFWRTIFTREGHLRSHSGEYITTRYRAHVVVVRQRIDFLWAKRSAPYLLFCLSYVIQILNPTAAWHGTERSVFVEFLARHKQPLTRVVPCPLHWPLFIARNRVLYHVILWSPTIIYLAIIIIIAIIVGIIIVRPVIKIFIYQVQWINQTYTQYIVKYYYFPLCTEPRSYRKEGKGVYAPKSTILKGRKT